MDLVFYPHGGSANHGCEAIVRSTSKLLGKGATLYSERPEQDLKVGLDSVCNIFPATVSIRRNSLDYVVAAFRRHLLKKEHAYDELLFKHMVNKASLADYFLSIGGDNYCYSGMDLYYLVNRMMDKVGVRRVLWGASVESAMIDSEMMKDLQGYRIIVARESLTYESLTSRGLSQTVLYPDPAFVLDKKIVDLPNNFIVGNTVGINLSPLIISCEKQRGCTFANFSELVKHIIRNTDMRIALIPHVVWEDNDDRKPLNELLDRLCLEFGKEIVAERVCMIEDCGCQELKYIISCCRFMIAARTHASIASYSTNVPTLVIGYSVKANGIAKDIFGTTDNYVISVQTLQNEMDLIKAFEWLRNNEDSIRNHYDLFMPEYINRAYALSRVLYEKS